MIFFLITTLVIASVALHYEALLQLSKILDRFSVNLRFKVALAVLGAILAHLAEIWIFALAYYGLAGIDRYGQIRGEMDIGFRDYIYFSSLTYTSLGYGDVTPHGSLRIIAAVEALLGLILIAWTASFIFMEMQKYWKRD